MAQTTVPVYLSGKLGSMVYTGNRQGTAVRMLVTPKNPETAGQTAQRQRFSAAPQIMAAFLPPPMDAQRRSRTQPDPAAAQFRGRVG
jgi:hypothetical protein